MDKITRMLLLYSKLIRGEPVNKVSFCMETESNERSFDRDIEDVRLYLSESFSTEEVIYNRSNNCYFLSGIAKQELEMTEYRFLERLIIQSGLLRKDELIGLLSILASNTTRPSECLRMMESHTMGYAELISAPLLKMHDDILTMIANQSVIEIKYHDIDEKIRSYRIIPYDIQFIDGQMYMMAFEDMNDNDNKSTKYFKLERIESFERRCGASLQDKLKIDGMKKKTDAPSSKNRRIINISCTEQFHNLLKKEYKDAVSSMENGQVSIYCDYEDFIKWIMSQDLLDYEIISPLEIREVISRKVIELYDKYRKE